jgi:amidase
LADGSDTMGSLRNPAAFNNVVGMRPSFGRVPRAPSGDVFFRQLGTDGPMARSVADVALLLSVQSGFDARSPLSSVTDPAAFARIAPRAGRGVRLAWLGDCGGHLPLEEGILELCEAALGAFALQGCHVEPVTVPYAMDRLWECWLTLRHWSIAAELGDLYTDPARRAQLKPEVVWEIEGGLAVSGSDLARAAAARSQWYAALRTLFERFDFLLLPSAQVFPFAADVHWPRAIAGHPMDTYHRWMEVVIGATLAGLPALGLPIGFNDAGLPMGMQIIGPAQADREVLAIAALLEEATGWSARCAPPSMGSAPAG